MLRVGNAIRMTPRDIDDLRTVTGCRPPAILNVDDFRAFIEKSKSAYPADTHDGYLVRAVIDRAAERMLRENTATPLTYRRQRPSWFTSIARATLRTPFILYRTLFPKSVRGHAVMRSSVARKA